MSDVNISKGSVLLLACFFPPENTAGAARPFRFYKYLQRFGYGVKVLTASRQDSVDKQENIICVSDPVQKTGSRILRFLVGGLFGRVVARESLTWAFRAFDAADQVVSGQKLCAVISTSPPIISNVVAGRLKEQYGVPWIADFRDPLVGNPDRKRSGLPRLRDVIIERWSFRRADALIANTDATLEMWKKKYPAYSKKMHLIWNGFDHDDTLGPMPLPQREYRLLVHAGGLLESRHPEILLSSLHRLIQQGRLSPRRLRVRLVGPVKDGWNRDPVIVEELVRLGCLEYDGLLLAREDAKQAMATADSFILLDWIAPGGAIQVPAKLFDYVRIGRPVLAITTRNSPAERLMSRGGIRYTSIYPEDPAEEVDGKVLDFLSLPTEAVVANEWFWKEFEAAAQTRQLVSLISAFVAGGVVQSRPCLAIGQQQRNHSPNSVEEGALSDGACRSR